MTDSESVDILFSALTEADRNKFAMLWLRHVKKRKITQTKYNNTAKGKKARQKAYYRQIQKDQGKYECSCGRTVSRNNKYHKRSQYHIKHSLINKIDKLVDKKPNDVNW